LTWFQIKGNATRNTNDWYARGAEGLVGLDRLFYYKIVEHRQFEWVLQNLEVKDRNLVLEDMIYQGLYARDERDLSMAHQSVMSYAASVACRQYSLYRWNAEKVLSFPLAVW
jgi:hypothetical protein